MSTKDKVFIFKPRGPGMTTIFKERTLGPTLIQSSGLRYWPKDKVLTQKDLEELAHALKKPNVTVETYSTGQGFNWFEKWWNERHQRQSEITVHFRPWQNFDTKETAMAGQDNGPTSGGPIPSINHGNTAPGAAGAMDHGKTTAAAALSANLVNKNVPVQVPTYPETGVPGEANKNF